MAPPWKVKLVPEFEAELKGKRLKHLERRIKGKLEELEAAAESLGKPLTGPLAGCRRVKLGGSHRLVYTLIGDVAWVLQVAPREGDKPYDAETARRLGRARSEQAGGGKAPS